MLKIFKVQSLDKPFELCYNEVRIQDKQIREAQMTGQQILDQMQEGTHTKSFSDFIPYDEPKFYQVETVAKGLVTLDRRFRWIPQGWYKLTQSEQKQAKRKDLESRFHILMTAPHLLV